MKPDLTLATLSTYGCQDFNLWLERARELSFVLNVLPKITFDQSMGPHQVSFLNDFFSGRIFICFVIYVA